MLFNTLPFLLLLPVIFFVYWTIPTGKVRWRNGYLLTVGAAAVYQRKHSTEVDTLKLSYIQKLIDDAKNEHIAICFVSSPRYGIPSEEDVYDFQVVRDICAENHVPYLDYYYTEGISDNYRYFQDTNHLNIEGARVFSSLISRQVKNIIVNNGFYGERFILGV